MKINGARTTVSDGCLVVEVTTDAGISGVALGAPSSLPHLAFLFSDLLNGEDPRGAPGLWQRMMESGGDAAAAATLDIALWDIKARAEGEPLWRMIGGARPRVRACGSAPAGDAALPRWLAEAKGLTAARISAGPDVESDRRRLEALASGLSREKGAPVLIFDLSGTGTPKDSIRRVRCLEETLDLACVEGVAASWDFLGHQQVRRAIRAGVCAGRGLRTPADLSGYFHHHAFDIVQVDISRQGISGALQLADAAWGFELPVILCAYPGNVQVQLAGALPNVMNAEIAPQAGKRERWSTDVRVEGAYATAGDAPGNGLAVDPEVLARAIATEATA